MGHMQCSSEEGVQEIVLRKIFGTTMEDVTVGGG